MLRAYERFRDVRVVVGVLRGVGETACKEVRA